MRNKRLLAGHLLITHAAVVRPSAGRLRDSLVHARLEMHVLNVEEVSVFAGEYFLAHFAFEGR